MTTVGPQIQYTHPSYPNHSIMEDASDDGESGDEEDDARYHAQESQQALYYQQYQQQQASVASPAQQANGQSDIDDGEVGEEAFSDESSMASIPDENIDFSLMYAFHTFIATVAGQASVVKGDSLLLLDDANAYWWLVRVLKTEDVGYLPAENIETPYERLARLNKHRNVDVAAATNLEKQGVQSQTQEKPKPISGKTKVLRMAKLGEDSENLGARRVIFAPPTYVEHPGVTWSSEEEDEGDTEAEDEEPDEVEQRELQDRAGGTGDETHEKDVNGVDESLAAAGAGSRRLISMEPDDGMEWADSAGTHAQQRSQEKSDQVISPKSNNPFAPQSSDSHRPSHTVVNEIPSASASATSLHAVSAGSVLDPAQAGNDTRRITATPAVAQGNGGVLLPSAMGQRQSANRTVSGQSVGSVVSTFTTSSSIRSITPTSPPDESGKKMKKSRKGSKEELDGGEKRKRGVLGGLFSRNKKDKKANSNGDPRTSEDSIVSGAVDSSPASQRRYSEESPNHRAPTPGDGRSPGITLSPPQKIVSSHGLRLAQRDQALQQAYTSKYLAQSDSAELLSKNPGPAVNVAHSAAAMRLSISLNGTSSGRPSSVILSPNPAGPPLLNVIRIFAGEHVRSDASFKTALINETTSSADLIRQAMQRLRLHHASTPGADAGYFLTIRDANGEEMELDRNEKALAVFQEAVQRWSEDDNGRLLDEMVPTVRRSSISSISSVMSLSSHPAIAKLGLNDFSDDSAVKIYLNRRRPGSMQVTSMPGPANVFSSNSTQLSAVQETSPGMRSTEWSSITGTPPGRSIGSDATATPPTPQQRYNPSLTVTTISQASPERFSSPSARFTMQLILKPSDLPESSAFDPASDTIIPRALLKGRTSGQTTAQDSRRRLFSLPRNATVVEAIEQGLERFGIQEGVVDGGDDVEDRGANRRMLAKVRYSLIMAIGGEERRLAPSSKVMDAYPIPPTLRPTERSTTEQRRRSRDFSQNNGSVADILTTDPIFMLRRVGHRSAQGRPASTENARHSMGDTPMQGRQQVGPAKVGPELNNRALSAQEIIAAQRAASRANQKALISAQINTAQGVDVVLPDRGTLRSSRLMEPNGEVVRYSYIDGDGETYDISELLEEEWGKDGNQSSPNSPQAPALLRQATDQSSYATAPSTPEPTTERSTPLLEIMPPSASQDLLRGVVQRAASQPDRLEEKLHRVINKVKISAKSTEEVSYGDVQSYGPPGRGTPQVSATPILPPLLEDPAVDATPRASDSRNTSRQASYQTTAASVNRIISRHRQQPSIASIMSDLSVPNGPDEDTGSSTPLTATSSSHPTPPFSGAVFTRSVNSASPTPRTPVVYKDDFGIKAMMAIIEARSREYRKPAMKLKSDAVQRLFYGERLDMETVHPDIRGSFAPFQARLDVMDKEIDELLGSIIATR